MPVSFPIIMRAPERRVRKIAECPKPKVALLFFETTCTLSPNTIFEFLARDTTGNPIKRAPLAT